MTHSDVLPYTADQLISWRKHARPLDNDVCRRVRALFFRRGCRGGKNRHRVVLSDAGHDHIPVISTVRHDASMSLSSWSLRRHTADNQCSATSWSSGLPSPLLVDSHTVPGTTRQRVLTTFIDNVITSHTTGVYEFRLPQHPVAEQQAGRCNRSQP